MKTPALVGAPRGAIADQLGLNTIFD